MLTIEDLETEVNSYKNTLVIDPMQNIAKIMGVIEEDDDFYWKFYSNDEGGIYYISCVGNWIPLKRQLKDKDYEELVRVWNLNNTEKVV